VSSVLWRSPLLLVVALSAGAIIAVVPIEAGTWGDCSSENPNRAIKACSAFIEAGDRRKKTLAMAHANLALAYNKQARFNEAIKAADQAIEIDPKNGNAYNIRGWAHYASNMLNEAIADYDKAVSLKLKGQQLAWTYNNRSVAYRDNNERDKAISDATMAIKINSKFPEAYNSRANGYLDKRDWKKALEDLNRALRLRPNYGSALYNRALVYGQLGDLHQSERDWRKAIEHIPESSQWWGKAKACLELVLNGSQKLC
jgi:tetratricopeptide (TPR) repeat protein